MRIQRWWNLWRFAWRRFHSEKDYSDFQCYQGRWVIEDLIRRGYVVSGRRILDLGCGYGGYSIALREFGAQVIALDLFPSFLLISGQIPTIRGNALRLPFADLSFEGIFCASLIEHVDRPIEMLYEIRRIVKQGGWIYLSFPPFYSPLGGHQFSPFHYFGERIALKIARRWRWWGRGAWISARCPTAPESFARAFGDYGLYPITIRKARALFHKAGLQVDYQGVRFLPLNLSKVPVLGEILTWHVEFVLRP
ncbi:MAG: class I SAM-dependent methyltransferase [Anaerolineae bacterium]|nr:class I SAM-dependent methyltransferase [Thermoflexus sp.]MDW8064574.1 class I SAM-dependent methyltransferase [Anaerolineae bacterium]